MIGTMVVMLGLFAAARLGLPLGIAHVELPAHSAASPWAAFVGDISILLLVIAMVRLTQMLRRIDQGETFSAEVIGRFRGFAFWLLVAALFGLVAPPLAQILSFAPGTTNRLELRIDFRGLLTVGVTLVLFLLARLLEQARRLDEENREFV